MNRVTPFFDLSIWLAVIIFVWFISPKDAELQNVVLVIPAVLVASFNILWRHMMSIHSKIDDIEKRADALLKKSGSF